MLTTKARRVRDIATNIVMKKHHAHVAAYV
jgi:hypothetical protein